MQFEQNAKLVSNLALVLACVGIIAPCRAATCDQTAAKASVKQVGDFFQSGGKMCAVLTNTSSACTFPAAVESFLLDPRNFSHEAQTFVDAQVVNLAPGQTQTVCAAL